ncbi:MAG: glycerol kinase GlpK [Spirochaetaceae bacterium]|nr:glycerol kinase GlpK [Spirochaetaceae bacterium]
MKDMILALDQGTTSSRAVIFDSRGKIISSSRNDFPQYTPQESWVEHDPEEIWESQLKAALDAIEKSSTGVKSIAALGITNQRETTVLWERISGKPVGRAIVWQCRRTAKICNRLKDEGYEELVHKRTGLKLDPYFSGTKICWKLEEIPGLRERAENGEILFGTIDTWLLWKLTQGKVHATDVTNASRTMLMNLETGEWDNEMLKILDIPRIMLPEIRPSIGFFGETDSSLFGQPIPISGVAGDQHAALFGHRAFEAGDVKNTYGTGCFMLMNVGDKPVYSKGGLLSTVAWGIDGKLTYALEGSVFMAGALLLWLRDNLGLVDSIDEINYLSEEVDDNGGVYLIPAYQGLGTPWWSNTARGTLTGLTRASTKAHVCRAYLESIAYRSRDVIDVMIADSGYKLNHLRVDGGVTNSRMLMQFQAGLLNIPVERPSFIEVTVLGAAMMAGLGSGLWKNFDSLKEFHDENTIFEPDMSVEKRDKLYAAWLDYVRKIT